MDTSINSSEFETLSLLGQGSYAKVFLVRHVPSQQLMAAKVINKELVLKRKTVSHILNEKNILSESDHPFVMPLYCSFQDRSRLFLMMEYCPGGELFRYLSKKGKLNQNQACFYTSQIAVALGYLHERNIVYRDLKPENVVLDQKGYIRITDFGLASYAVQEKSELLGTPQYFAPEIASGKAHGKQVDWWCLGMILYEMVVGATAFQAGNKSALMDKIRETEPVYPQNISNKLKSLLQSLLRKEPQERLGANGVNEVLGHPWFQKIDMEQLMSQQIQPPFVPTLKSKTDISNFDPRFTTAQATLFDQQVQGETDDQEQQDEHLFKGFQCMKIDLTQRKKGKAKQAKPSK